MLANRLPLDVAVEGWVHLAAGEFSIVSPEFLGYLLSCPFSAEEFGLLPSRAVELLKNAAFQDLTPLPSPECYENCKNQALTPSTPMSRGSFMLR